MSEEVYSSIPNLIDSLKHHTLNLENGKLPYESLEEMLDNARELYDRLVVLRYKAYEEMVRANSHKEAVKEINHSVGEEKIEPASKKMNFRFNLSSSSVSEPEEVKKEPEPQPVRETPKQQVKKDKQEPKDYPKSVNERLSKLYDEESLVSKLQKAPIQDLKSAIGINQKFLFIQDLFNGDVEAYSQAINHLNNFESFKEASHYLRNDLASEYGWSTENHAVSEIIELVERRYS